MESTESGDEGSPADEAATEDSGDDDGRGVRFGFGVLLSDSMLLAFAVLIWGTTGSVGMDDADAVGKAGAQAGCVTREGRCPSSSSRRIWGLKMSE